MNTQERDQLQQFLQQLTEVKLSSKDTEADSLIREAIARQPDAAYLLIQRSLLQDQALRTAQTQIAELQNQLQRQAASPAGGGFLNDNPWATPSSSDNRVPGTSQYQMPNRPAAGMNYAPAAAPNQGPGFGSSFLGNVATTAAGVVAGSFLFQGIESLLGQHHTPSPWHDSAADAHANASEQHAPEQTIINNYYGDSNDQNDQLAHTASYDPFPADDGSADFSDDNAAESDWI